MDTPEIKEEVKVMSQSSFHRYMTGPVSQAPAYKSSFDPNRRSAGILSLFKLENLEKVLAEPKAKEAQSLPASSSPSVLVGLKAAT